MCRTVRTHVSEGLDATFDVGLLGGVEPGAVVHPEGRLQQLNEDGLVRLGGKRRKEERRRARESG